MEEEKFEKSQEKNKINETNDPKIFDVTEEKLDYRDCWPDCSPCSPSDDCSPDVVCTPDMNDDWEHCKPCSPNDISRNDYDDYHNGWSSCSPCSPTDDCSPDFSEDGK